MPATTYRIWAWGGPVNPLKPDGAVRIGVAGVAKRCPINHPYEIANEVVCGDLARALRLPIPPSAVVVREADGVSHYVSLDFSPSGETLPDAYPAAIARDLPTLACGVIAFDLWVYNNDRHQSNLAYDEDVKSLLLFDHGMALVYGPNWRRRLENPDDGDILNGHCLTGEIHDMSGFVEWVDRIRALPEEFIRQAVADVRALGFGKDEADACTKFLLDRRRILRQIIRKHKRQFFNLGQGQLSFPKPRRGAP